MKKTAVIIISILLIAGFVGLVWHGAQHSRGIPAAAEKIERVKLGVPFIDKEIELSGGIAEDMWNDIEPKEIKLMQQVTVLPWGTSLVSPIKVKAFHNKRDIYFHISWHDETEARTIERNRFSDACAILFPMDDDAEPPTIMMGFLGKANIWQWKASQDREFWLSQARETKAYADFYYPFEEEELFPVSKDLPKSGANDLIAIRVGTITPKDTQNVQGRGFWRDGVWQVVFRRAFDSFDEEEDAVFISGKKRLCAFAVWNGEKGDRGGRKSISDWVELDIM